MNEHVKAQLYAVPGFLILGVGINSVFGPPDSKIHPLLESQFVGYGLLIVGGVFATIALVKGVTIFKNRSKS